MNDSIVASTVRAVVAPSVHTQPGQPTRIICLRRPRPTNLPRFETRSLPGHPGGFEVVDRFGIRVGEYLTRRGAERAALRLNAAVARACLFAPDRIPVEALTEPGMPLDADDLSDHEIDELLAEEAFDEAPLPRPPHREYEEAELSEMRIRHGHIDCYS